MTIDHLSKNPTEAIVGDHCWRPRLVAWGTRRHEGKSLLQLTRVFMPLKHELRDSGNGVPELHATIL